MPASPIAAPAGIFGKGSFIQKYSDVLIAVAIIIIVVMMIIPLPTLLLDLLICLNITIALLVIMSVIYNKEALDLSIFPSLLLITTLFRLALNISSTRLILLDGFAGEVITAFGNFVVGGNPVVGFIMFIILVGINFIVITKGSERVAEVSARFTLDAMPGKQMAIDADLNQGAITDAQAKERRIKIQREADFFGAMDGASKFVKGDAIAAIVIMMINITGGFVIGMLQRNLSAVQALQQYTLLTVGEGLVSQIPALLISTATGLIVTRAGAEGNLGADMVSQLASSSFCPACWRSSPSFRACRVSRSSRSPRSASSLAVLLRPRRRQPSRRRKQSPRRRPRRRRRRRRVPRTSFRFCRSIRWSSRSATA